jgi:hypothetical protein
MAKLIRDNFANPNIYITTQDTSDRTFNYICFTTQLHHVDG